MIVSADGKGIVSQPGGLLLTRTLAATGLGRGLSAGLARWRAPRAVHDPGKIVADLAVTVALGGDCLADIALLRAEPGLFGPVASDPVVSRLVARLAVDAPRALKAIRAARAAARKRAWELAGNDAPGADGGLVTVDLDATIVTSYSDKGQAAPTWKKTYGFHPLTAFADHGAAGSGEPLAILLRPGNAGSNTAADHIEAARLALAQLPPGQRKKVLIRLHRRMARSTASWTECNSPLASTALCNRWATSPATRSSCARRSCRTSSCRAAILAAISVSVGWPPAWRWCRSRQNQSPLKVRAGTPSPSRIRYPALTPAPGLVRLSAQLHLMDG